MKFLWSYIKKHKRFLFLALLAASVSNVFAFLDAQIFRLIVDNYAGKIMDLSASQFFKGVSLLLVLYIAVELTAKISNNLEEYYGSVVSQHVGATLYADGVEHAFSLPYHIFEDQRSGEILQKLEKARTDTQELIINLIRLIYYLVIAVTFVIIYSFFVHPLLGMVFLVLTPFIGFVTMMLSRKIRSPQQTIVAHQSSLAGFTTETLRNVELVKSLGLEAQEIHRLNQANDNILSLELKKVKLIRTFRFFQGSIISSMRVILMIFMLWLIYSGEITIGEFFTLFLYSFYLFSPMTDLGRVATQYQETLASLGMLQEILQIKPEETNGKVHLKERIRRITFEDAGFAYSSSKRAAVCSINLRFKAGHTIGIVGPSGSGKTTIIKLLAGLYSTQKGNILINDIKASEINYRELRNRIGLVTQETQLFAGSIRYNLSFANPDANDSDCLASLELASVIDILDRGDEGLDTKIGEGGLKLSGGERQRLAIARALLRDPDIIIFDEATSSLDAITEKAITDTIFDIKSLRPDVITIIVTHRLSSVSKSDHIYVLENGVLVESDNHEGLLKAGGLYAAMWRQQMSSTTECEVT